MASLESDSVYTAYWANEHGCSCMVTTNPFILVTPRTKETIFGAIGAQIWKALVESIKATPEKQWCSGYGKTRNSKEGRTGKKVNPESRPDSDRESTICQLSGNNEAQFLLSWKVEVVVLSISIGLDKVLHLSTF